MPDAFDQIQHDQALQDYWMKRIFASIIDVILVLTPVYILMGLLLFMGNNLWFNGGIVSGFVWFVYSVFFEIGAGATIGKMLLGMKVISVDGKKLEPDQLITRNITKLFALLIVVDLILAFFTETTDPRQRYMDRVAKTALVFGKTG